MAFSFSFIMFTLIYIFIRQLNEKEFIIFRYYSRHHVLGLTGCDDKKAETETLPPANSQPAAPAPEAKPTEAPVAKAEAKPETPAQPVVDEQAVFDEKMDVYIKCYNKLQIPVQRSLARYADWLKDFKQGPTGEERTVYGIYGISESNLAECEKGVKVLWR